MSASSEGERSPALVREVRLAAPLHARPAGGLVRALAPLDAWLQLEYDGRVATGSSVLALLALGADTGALVTVRATGAAAAHAVEAAVSILTRGEDPQ